jgi:hypothetical protein
VMIRDFAILFQSEKNKAHVILSLDLGS